MRKRLVWSLALNLIAIITSVSVPMIFRRIIDSFSNLEFSYPGFFLLLVFYLALWFSNRLFKHLREIALFPVTEKVIALISLDLFKHIQSLPFQYHAKKKTGEIAAAIDAINRSTPSVISGLLFSIFPLVFESLLAFLIVLSSCGALYAFVLAFCTGAFFFFTRRNFVKFFRLFQKSYKSHAKTNGKIFDSLLNFSSVKYFNTYEFEFKKIEFQLENRALAQSTAYTQVETTRFYQTFVLSCGLACLVFISAFNVIKGKLTIGEFAMIHAYILHFLLPFESLGQIFQRLIQGLITLDKALKFLKQPQDKKKGDRCEEDIKTNTIRLINQKPLHIVFDNVWFSYEPNKPVLKGVSFELKPYHILCILGESGSGKSTIAGLLLRLLKPDSGKIFLNNYDIQMVEQESLNDLISIVPQDITLFNESLYHNIHYANLQAEENKIHQAVERSQLKNSLLKLPQGLHTPVGERGIQLSGGEKQRVALARAFMRSSKLYIFDEGTSALDAENERKVIENFRQFSTDASAIFITHHVSTLAFADQAIILKDGQMHPFPPQHIDTAILRSPL